MLSGYRKPKRFAVFISGGGSTLQSLLEMQHILDIKLVVTNRKSAPGLRKANRFGVPVLIQDNRMSFEKLNQALVENNIERIILAGFMKIIPPEFVSLWKDRMINIHPSLLPAYKGLKSAERSWQDNHDMGVSLHKVTELMDEGEVIKRSVSLTQPRRFDFQEALLLLRRTEQHLLRNLTAEWSL